MEPSTCTLVNKTNKVRRSEATILVYLSDLLPSAQIFIRSQVGSVENFAMQYAGLQPPDGGFESQLDPILLCNRHTFGSRAIAAAYKLTGYAPEFKRKIARTNAALMHAHFLREGTHALPLAISLGLPLVVSLHGHSPTGAGRLILPHRLDSVLYRRRLPELWSYASKFLCVSEFVREKAIAAGFPSEKLVVHYIGIDLERFKPTEGKQDAKKIVFVGRLVEKKGCRYLIEAMRIVQSEDPSAHLVIVGEGPERLALEERARAYGLRCVFLGDQNQQTVQAEIASARVFCAPSVIASDEDAEDPGMVFAEAQAVGVPVVSFRSGGIPEVVKHQVTGLLAPEKDVVCLTTNLLRYLRDDSFRERSSTAAVEWVRDRFDIRKQTKALEAIYSWCLDEHAIAQVRWQASARGTLIEFPS